MNKGAETSASYGRKLETKVRIYILIIVLSNLEQYQHLNEEASYTRKLRFFGRNMMVKSGVFFFNPTMQKIVFSCLIKGGEHTGVEI